MVDGDIDGSIEREVIGGIEVHAMKAQVAGLTGEDSISVSY
jgi:hypothetical protein